jgi:hypothetical protein
MNFGTDYRTICCGLNKRVSDAEEVKNWCVFCYGNYSNYSKFTR